ncbi:uncharacterized protein METZ01_LOCUS354301, partial [marine metagenome]
MNLDYTDSDQSFRHEVQNFIQDKLPADIKAKIDAKQKLTKDDYMAWHKILHSRGWVAPNWPVEFGGPGWTPLQCHIFDEEIGLAGVPRVLPFGVAMVGPVIMEFGTNAQKEYYLPRILSSEDVWCQGYSEPGSGSDLASLKTSAVRDGEEYVV